MTFKKSTWQEKLNLKPSMTMWMSGTTAMTRERWRNSLGLNADEEDAWIDDGDEALKEMLDAGKQ